MRLFYQLMDEEKEVSIKHCLHKIAHDLLCEKIDIKQLLEDLDIVFITDNEGQEMQLDDNTFLDNFNREFEKVKNLSAFQDKFSRLMDNEYTAYLLMEAASALAEKTYYHDPDEYVIYPDLLLEESENNKEDENDEQEETDTKNKSMN